MSRAQVLYDAVTRAWAEWVMGEDLHFGLFDDPSQALPVATRALTTHLAEKAQLGPDLEVLDVGCGIGTAARLLAQSFDCRVTGISNSQVGLDEARRRSQSADLAGRVQFVFADAMDNQLPDQSFDRVFSLESTHLMPDKTALFAECHRVLRPGGRLALCDVCLVGALGAEQAELMRYVMLGHSATVAARMRDAVHETMHRAFGSTKMTHYRKYVEAAETAGFTDIEIEDVSKRVKPTLEHWGKNASEHAEAIAAAVGPAYLDDLFVALLHMSFGWGQVGGYIVMTARKGA